MTADDPRPAVAELLAQGLFAHTAWSMTGPNDDGTWSINCYDCGEVLGEDKALVREWEQTTGHDNHHEWRKGTSVPAYGLAVSRHQAVALLPIVLRFGDERAAEALREIAAQHAAADAEAHRTFEALYAESLRDPEGFGEWLAGSADA